MVRAPLWEQQAAADSNVEDLSVVLRLELEDLRTRLLTLEWQDEAGSDEAEMLRQTIADWEAQSAALMVTMAAPAPPLEHIQSDVIVISEQAAESANCVICLESFEPRHINKLRCKHHMCDDCLRELFVLATNDQMLMPAKCCDKIIASNRVYSQYKKLISYTENEQYRAKRLEFSLPNPVYCSKAGCGAFIPPKSITQNVAICRRLRHRTRCQFRTCTKCRGPAHENDLQCPNKDEATIALENLARSRGWRQCARCHHFVELSYGCNHMTCRCGHEFCYECSAVWRTCQCTMWREERLIQQRQAAR